MNVRTVPGSLAAIGAALCVAEGISTVELWARGGPENFPLFALGFALLFGLGAWLLASGRVVAGALVVGILAAFEVVDYPQWAKHGTFDRIFDTTIAAVALIGVTLALAVLVGRTPARGRVRTGRVVRR